MVWDSRNLGEREEFECGLTAGEFRRLYTCKHGVCPLWECPQCKKESEAFWRNLEKVEEKEDCLISKGSLEDLLYYFEAKQIDGQVKVKVYTFDGEQYMSIPHALEYLRLTGARRKYIQCLQKLYRETKKCRVVVIFRNYGALYKANIIPLSALPYSPAPQYLHSLPNGKIAQVATPVWLSAQGVADVREHLKLQGLQPTDYITPATVHGNWKVTMHQGIIYATEIKDITRQANPHKPFPSSTEIQSYRKH